MILVIDQTGARESIISDSRENYPFSFAGCVRNARISALPPPAKKPNIVTVMDDQWRAQAVGYMGNRQVITSNLDKLASEAVNARLFMAEVPVCAPSRASLLTGQHALTHGVFYNDRPLRNEAITLAEVCQQSGYQTGFIGKWHINGGLTKDYRASRLAPIPADRRQGFEYWRGLECTHDYNDSPYYNEVNKRFMWQQYDAINQTDSAIAYMTRKHDAPFLLYLAWGPPHDLYQTAPKEYRQKYANMPITLRPNVPSKDTMEARRALRGYYAHINALDDCIGRLQAAMKAANLDENTIFIFTSDHGDMIYSHDQINKQKPWEESIRVPFLLKYPAGLGSKGCTMDVPMTLTDVMPTVLSLSNQPIPASVEGHNYADLFRSPRPPKPAEAALFSCIMPFHQWNYEHGGREFRGIRTARYTYVRDLKGPWLLYDNMKDPYQLTNVVNKADAAQTQRQLDELLTRKLRETKDEFLTGNIYGQVALPLGGSGFGGESVLQVDWPPALVLKEYLPINSDLPILYSYMIPARFTAPLLTFAFFIMAVMSRALPPTTSDLKPLHLRTEYKINPVTDAAQPRMSWELTSAINGQVQTAYQIMVASSAELLVAHKADFWDSNKVPGNATNQVEYAGKLLPARTTCFWKVRSWDKNGQPGAWSQPASWEMGLLNKTGWQAQWIGNDLTALGKGKTYHLPPAPFFRKETTLKSPVKRARLYVTALGLYQFHINGKRIGKDYFTPGWTDYNKRVYYQTYDVTNDVKPGKNALGAVLSDGWYAGYLGYALLVENPVVSRFYGDVPLLKAQIEVEYADGNKETIVTDQSWKTNHGPIVEADILNGETYNATLEFDGWNKAGFTDSAWKNAAVYPDKADRQIETYPGDPVRVFQELKAKTVTPKSGGKYLFDLGQNFAGVVRLRVTGNKGDTIRLRYGEVLFPNGDIMTENLRKARATDTYILKGDKQGETWMPRFTYHGFQYVEVSGFRKAPTLDAITGIVLTSATPEAGSFTTDNKMVNQLYHNIVWTQRSNYFDVPTDCPQRDERLGWTGDAQTYVQSATFNNDIAAFYTKWLVDLNDAQRADKSYPIYAPAPNVRKTDTYSPGWSEAGIICPYTIYKTYNDTRMIREFWPNMVAYLDFLERKSNGQYVYKEASFEDVSPKGGFGDWLSVGKKTPPDMLATMYYAYVTAMMAEMATAIDKPTEAAAYEANFAKIRQAFLNHYADETGRFKTNAAAYGNGEGYVDGEMGFDGHTQTAYANAIYMHMLSADQTEKAGNYLMELIKANSGKLSTGFLGVKPLLPALSATGHSDEAYKLLLRTDYPSWGFEVVNGANTIWERWNSYVKGKGFENNAGMNSFNHYAFGSVNEWLFENAAGIKVGEAGYRTFTIKPEIANSGINSVKATYQSINGRIESSWKKRGQTVSLTVAVPVNTRATVFIPATNSTNPTTILEGGKPLKSNVAIQVNERSDGYQRVEVGSGTYQFTSQ